MRGRFQCLDGFLSSAGKRRLGRGTRVIEVTDRLLMIIAIVLFGLALLAYFISAAFFKVPIVVARKLMDEGLVAFATALFTWIGLLAIENFTLLILGLRGLAYALPALINELRLPREIDQCLIKHFSGDAAEVLSRVYKHLLLLLAIYLLLIFLSFITTAYFALILAGYSVLSLSSSFISLLLSFISSFMEFTYRAITETAVRTVLGVLGVVLAIVFSVGSWFIGGRLELNEAILGFIHNVRFFILEWFTFTILIIIASMVIPPFYAVLLPIPLTLAITISLTAYLTLATAVIEYMQLPRGRAKVD
jgi:hypothetical protein